MTEQQFTKLNAKLEALIKVAELSAVFYSQTQDKLRNIENLLLERGYE